MKNDPISILVIDDEPLFRGMVEMVLRKGGYVTSMAGDGTEAVEIARDRSFDVALIDVVMPGQNGCEIAQQLCAIQPKIKIIFMSGYNECLLREKGYKTDPHEVMSKPLPLPQLMKRLNDFVPSVLA